jgi:DNA-binding response OmpR family regulator
MNMMNARVTGAADDFVAVSVFPAHEDHAVLRSIFRSSDRPLCPGSTWALQACTTLDEALPILKNGGIPLVLCECDLQPGSWKEVLAALEALPDPPYLIVTSKHADDRLWAEALNLGAYDVLPEPFDAAEVMRTLSIAWLRWNEREKPTRASLVKSAA